MDSKVTRRFLVNLEYYRPVLTLRMYDPGWLVYVPDLGLETGTYPTKDEALSEAFNLIERATGERDITLHVLQD